MFPLASKVGSTLWGVAALPTVSSSRQAGPECLSAQPGLPRVLGPSDHLAGRPEKGALSGLSVCLRSLQGVRSFPVAELKPLRPQRWSRPPSPWQTWREEGDLRLPHRTAWQGWEWQAHADQLGYASLVVSVQHPVLSQYDCIHKNTKRPLEGLQCARHCAKRLSDIQSHNPANPRDGDSIPTL